MFKPSWCERYMDFYSDRWDKKTVRCKTSMLNKLKSELGNCSVEEFFAYIDSSLKPYSRVTYISLVKDYYQWLLETGRKGGDNAVAKTHRRRAGFYKHAYERKTTGISFEEAKKRISQIEPPEIREICSSILHSGIRISELFNVEEGIVTGKYKKKRPYFGHKTCEEGEIHPNTIRNHLRKVGLKPHDLRKAFATKLIDSGLNQGDVVSAMGWKSFKTAAFYFQPKEDARLKDIVKGALE